MFFAHIVFSMAFSILNFSLEQTPFSPSVHYIEVLLYIYVEIINQMSLIPFNLSTTKSVLKTS